MFARVVLFVHWKPKRGDEPEYPGEIRDDAGRISSPSRRTDTIEPLISRVIA